MIETTTHDKLHTEVAALKADLTRVRKDLTEMASTLLDEGRRTARAARQGVQQRVEGSLHSVQDYVSQRPFASTLMALGAGLLLGTWIGRK